LCHVPVFGNLPVPTPRAARALLGMTLVRRCNGVRLSGRIVEVEAYSQNDPASHSYGGKVTARNATMFGPAGRAYVYFTYGNHHCLNVVVGRKGFGAAVLIRALEPLEGIETMRRLRNGRPDRDLCRGPGRLTQALAVNLSHDGIDLFDSDVLWLETGRRPRRITTGLRIGITRGTGRLWRFCDTESSCLSRKP
jgi:DNA-3-methyladenine glycosylase